MKRQNEYLFIYITADPQNTSDSTYEIFEIKAIFKQLLFRSMK